MKRFVLLILLLAMALSMTGCLTVTGNNDQPDELPPEEHAEIEQVPGTLSEVLDALEADHEYLLEGDVFTADLIETWIEWKRKNEVDPIRFRPHPHEFEMYYDL